MNTPQIDGNWTSCPGGSALHTTQGVSASIWPRTWGGYGWQISITDEIRGWRSVAEGQTDNEGTAKAEAEAHMLAALATMNWMY